jgi:hypothetical protein
LYGLLQGQRLGRSRTAGQPQQANKQRSRSHVGVVYPAGDFGDTPE